MKHEAMEIPAASIEQCAWLGLVSLLIALWLVAAPALAQQKPNILFIMARKARRGKAVFACRCWSGGRA